MNKSIFDIKYPSPCFFYPIIKEMGVSVSELLTGADIQKNALLKLAQDYPFGAVIRMTELWAEAASFGMAVDMSENDFPRLSGEMYCDAEELEAAEIPMAVNEYTKPLIEAVRLVAGELDKPLIVGVTAPYTLGSLLCGTENFMVNCMTEPELVHSFLERVGCFLREYIAEYKKAGADGIILAEPSTAMLSPEMAEEFSNAHIEQLIRDVQDEDFFVIYHNCGGINHQLSGISKLSARGFHFGSDVDLEKALNIIPKDRVVMGNIDPRLFLSSNPESIKKEIADLQEKYLKYNNFVLSTGCDLSPNVVYTNFF